MDVDVRVDGACVDGGGSTWHHTRYSSYFLLLFSLSLENNKILLRTVSIGTLTYHAYLQIFWIIIASGVSLLSTFSTEFDILSRLLSDMFVLSE